MHRNDAGPFNTTKAVDGPPLGQLEWDWDVEHADRDLEREADAVLHGATPFQVDRRVLKDVVREKMSSDVGRITFLTSGEPITTSSFMHQHINSTPRNVS
jgi:hypothetical protein